MAESYDDFDSNFIKDQQDALVLAAVIIWSRSRQRCFVLCHGNEQNNLGHTTESVPSCVLKIVRALPFLD